MVADVRKRIKQGQAGLPGGSSKDAVDGNPTDSAKEMAEVKKMLMEHKKKQDRILMLLEQVCSKHPETFGMQRSGHDQDEAYA